MDLASDPDLLPVLIAGTVFLALLLGGIALSVSVSGRNRVVRSQLRAMERRWKGTERAEAPERIDSTPEESELGKQLGRLVPRRAILQDRLEQTGSSMSVLKYALLCLALVGFFTLIVMLVFKRSLVLGLPIGIFLGLGIPHWMLGVLGRRRVANFLQLFPEAIDLIVRGLKSGLPIQESIANVAREVPDPVGIEFRRIDDGVKVGRPLEEMLWATARRIDSPDFKFFVISLSVQRETGGNLAEALQNLSDILRRRRQMRLKVRALSSEARASAYIIGSLPFVMFMLLMLVNAGYVTQLFTDPRGMILVGIGLLSMLIGVVVMFKMVRFEI
ncbi:MAG: type II secretion system F family protein [Alphaproteobacteria bacterium]|nr:type II secretion system F family protein [Alphaproteobacteria bacterium]